MTTIQPKRIFKIVEAFARRFIPTVSKPPIGLQVYRRPEKAIAIPPMARASGGTAKAEDAFVVAIELVTVFG
jgi:hypothetical protein